MDSTCAQLKYYAETQGGPLAVMTSRWFEFMVAAGRGEEAEADPILQNVLGKAQMAIACGWKGPVPLTIFCDGSCLNNGATGDCAAVAGYGVYVSRGTTDVHRWSARVPASEPQSNQRAELLALQYALNYAAEASDSVEIYTDSRYAMDCLLKWAPAWEAAGWRKADKKPISHLEVIKSIVELYRALEERVKIQHVEAHTGRTDVISRGNAVADELARIGASMDA